MPQVILIDAQNINWNLSNGFSAKLVADAAVGGTRNLFNSILTSGEPGESYQLIFKQDSIGGRKIVFGDKFTVFGQFNLNPNAITVISFIYDPDETITILTHGLEETCQPFEVIIQGAIVYAIGKTNLTVFENGDTFRYYFNGSYFVGKIIDATSITLPQDINDEAKITLNVNT